MPDTPADPPTHVLRYIFFALYNTLGKTAAFIGPFITSAIIDDANGNTNEGFWFTFITGLIALVLIALVDTDKAKQDNAKYLEHERERLYASYAGAPEITAPSVGNAAGTKVM